MKGGKDEEKIVGPLFPRLHVNDTEKGGPRAPPRNKMALYEQFSIPSRRIDSGAPSTLPLPASNSSNLVSSGSSSQGVGQERNTSSPFYISPTPTHSVENLSSRSSNGVSLNTTRVDFEQKFTATANHRTSNGTRCLSSPAECTSFHPNEFLDSRAKNIGDGDDCRVPTFVLSGTTPCSNRDQISPVETAVATSKSQLQDVCDKQMKWTNSTDLKSRQYARNQREGSSTTRGCSEKPASHPMSRGRIGEPLKHTGSSSNQEHGNASRARGESCSEASFGDEHRDPKEAENGSDFCEAHGSLQTGDVARSDDVSETSIVDSISGLDISPDDVVGVIGQKHFWKARRVIASQQRVFAVQVFELHRLIKVQRLIAASPHLLLEDNHYFGDPSLKISPVSKLPSENVLKKPPQIVKQKGIDENTVRKLPLPSRNDNTNRGLVNQHSSDSPYSSNPPWCFPPSGNQWLVPVMSPSEGLVYKPYSGLCPPTAGFMAPAYGGCVPLSLPPMAGDFMNAAYGVPAPHQQGIGVPHGVPPVDQAYIPHNGMPVSNPVISGSAVDAMSSFSGARPHGLADQLSTGKVNFSMYYQTSCNMSSQKNVAKPSKDSEVQGSTASSPFERTQGAGMGCADGGSALSVFPTAPSLPFSDQPTQPHSSDQRTQVIKAVPHNRRSASESVARIFRSIQEERKQ